MDFCAKMCGQLLLDEIKNKSEVNLVISPLSFHAILHMIATGASGKTLKQLLKFLECKNMNEVHSKFSDIMSIASAGDDDNGGGPDICCLNGAWADQRFPLKASFKDVVEKLFKTRAKNVNMLKPREVVEETNAWAEAATKGLITDVLKVEHIKPTTRLILGNALYFKGFWDDTFIHTMNKDFYLLNGEKVSVPFMTGCHNYFHGSFDGFDLVKIPYRAAGSKQLNGKSLSFYIFLPNKNDGLQDLLQKAVTDFEFFGQHFKLEKNCYHDMLWIPKFKMTYDTEKGREKIIEMGLNLPFDEDNAELTEIMLNGELFVSTVIQKAYIEIDEKGTEAAAVTYESDDDMTGCLVEIPPTIFVADHPFMFMVREDESRSMLFTGALLNPLLKG